MKEFQCFCPQGFTTSGSEHGDSSSLIKGTTGARSMRKHLPFQHVLMLVPCDFVRDLLGSEVKCLSQLTGTYPEMDLLVPWYPYVSRGAASELAPQWHVSFADGGVWALLVKPTLAISRMLKMEPFCSDELSRVTNQ
eukprot:2387433-Amphidinium_carterae.1